MTSFSQRSTQRELMDDLNVGGAELRETLYAIRKVNRFLGGHAVSKKLVRPLLRPGPIRLLDVGAGLGDHAVALVIWADRLGYELHVTTLDANLHAVEDARRHVRDALPAHLAGRVEVVFGDALSLPFGDGSFDGSLAALFLHHFQERDARKLLRELGRVSPKAVLINDLHRHRIAYLLFRLMGAVLPGPKMFWQDGALSVLRGFRRRELEDLATAAGFENPTVRWNWAFRWSMTAAAS